MNLKVPSRDKFRNMTIFTDARIKFLKYVIRYGYKQKPPNRIFCRAKPYHGAKNAHQDNKKKKKKKRIYQQQNFILKFLSGCFGLDASRPKTLAVFRRNIAFYRCVGKFTLFHCPGGVDMLTPYYYGMEQRWNKVDMVGGRAEWASPALSAYDDVVCLRQMSTYLCNKTVSFICNHIFVAGMFCLRALWHPACLLYFFRRLWNEFPYMSCILCLVSFRSSHSKWMEGTTKKCYSTCVHCAVCTWFGHRFGITATLSTHTDM